jgi:hypothetical protein
VPLGVSNFVNKESTYKNIYIKCATRPPSGRLELGLAQKELFLFSLQLVFTSCSCSLHLFVLSLSILWTERTLTKIYISHAWRRRCPAGSSLAQKELSLFSLQLVFTSCSYSLHLFFLSLSVLSGTRTWTVFRYRIEDVTSRTIINGAVGDQTVI